jgi:UDP-GlcNAc3NAcA epimerase
MKVVTIVGARPQFIKATPVSKALREAGHTEFILHTGQHYDYGMSQVFFDELGLPVADVNLNVQSGNHGQQTGQMLIGIEKILIKENPDWVLVFGDTNSTLAGALAAVKLQIPLAHVEAGLRSFNRNMPEEHNRVLTDQCANMLFCPTKTAVDNLRNEGITQNVHMVGDTMYEAVIRFSEFANQRSSILKDFKLTKEEFLLASVHCASNTDNQTNLLNILTAFIESEEEIIFPVHPRTMQKIKELGILDQNSNTKKLRIIEPVGYLDMLTLERNARLILTDTGGMQKEAYWLGVPCLTLRDETEWVETVESGWNLLVGTDLQQILNGLQHRFPPNDQHPAFFGDGQSAHRIVQILGEM